jgi:hypothetical protein
MRWEALAWSALLIAAPAAVNVIWNRFDPPVPSWAKPILDGAGWLHGLLLPYIALLVGSIPGGLVGLYGPTRRSWLTGGLACLLGLAAVLIAHRMLPRTIRPRRALVRWRDEPRWALYRATGALWLGDSSLGAGVGFILSILEWVGDGLTHPGAEERSLDPEVLYRSGVSTILYLITGNFWLTAGTQLAFFVLLELWSERG